MFGLGAPELIGLALIGLLLFGPKRLPELAKNLGKGMRDFKKALEGKDEDQEKRLTKDVNTPDSSDSDKS